MSLQNLSISMVNCSPHRALLLFSILIVSSLLFTNGCYSCLKLSYLSKYLHLVSVSKFGFLGFSACSSLKLSYNCLNLCYLLKYLYWYIFGICFKVWLPLLFCLVFIKALLQLFKVLLPFTIFTLIYIWYLFQTLASKAFLLGLH